MRLRQTILGALAALALTGAGARAEPDRAALREQGKVLYGTYCARCHGEDGADTRLYPGAKSLVDISQRMTTAEIVSKSRGFAAVALDEGQANRLVAHLETFRSGGYARPELLVETGWVALHGQDPGVRLVDLRSAAAYAAGHIPGAVRLEEGPLRSAEDRLTYLPRPEVLAAMLGKAAIGNKTHVVAYDDQGGRMAARLWYILQAFGHERVSLVNGGWTRWSAEKRPVTMEVPPVTAVTFVPKSVPDLTCPSPDVVARKPGVVVLDTRSANEHTTGRIPGAVNVEWKENLTGPEMTFKGAAALRKLYAAKGVTPDKEIVTYCASGGRASHSLFALKLLGYPKVRVYYGSWGDYTSRPEAPVEK